MRRLYSKRVWNERTGRFEPGLIEIRKGRIDSIDFGSKRSLAKTEDLGESFVGPSAIDLHIHSRGFDENHKEDFESLEAAAQRGGVGLMACMANTQPRLDSPKRILDFLRLTKNRSIRMLPFAAVTEKLEGKTPTAWKELLKMPIAGLSDDGKPLWNEEIFVAALKATKAAGKLLSLHEEDLSCSEASVIHLSEASMRTGHKGSPEEAETRMVERDLAWAARLRAPIHLCHLSSEKTLSLIRRYQKKGVKVSSELTPHHALLSVEDFREREPLEWSQFKVCPVIRERSDREALCRAARSGLISVFASDHAPHSRLEKDRPMESAAHGILSLENHLPLYDLVRRRSKLSWGDYFRLSAQKPADLLGLGQEWGHLKPGYWANLIVFEETKPQDLEWGRSKSSNGPWKGLKAQVRMLQHWSQGRQVYG